MSENQKWTEEELQVLINDEDSLFGTFLAAWKNFPELTPRQCVVMAAMEHPMLNPNHTANRAGKLIGISRVAVTKHLKKMRVKLEDRKTPLLGGLSSDN